MVEVTVEISDLEYDIMQLYNDGERVRTIKQVLGISEHIYYKAFKRLSLMGLITPRGHVGKRVKPTRIGKPKYYSYNTSADCFSIFKNGTYYCSMKTRKRAEAMVELLKECDWDKSKVNELKAKVMEWSK